MKKYNIIDFCVILILLAAVSVVLITMLARKPQYKTIYLELDSPLPYLAQEITDVSSGRTLGTISGIETSGEKSILRVEINTPGNGKRLKIGGKIEVASGFSGGYATIVDVEE